MAEPEHQSHSQNHAQAGKHAGQDAQQHGTPVMLEEFQLLIQRNRQANGRRRQQIVEVLCALVIFLVADSGQRQKCNGNHNGNQKRIQNCQLKLFLQQHPDAVRNYTDCNAKKGGIL